MCVALKNAMTEQRITQKEFPPEEYQVKIYPNPTKGKVNLVWSAELGKMIQKVEFVAYNFTQYRELPFDRRENRILLDLSEHPIGMYVVVFHLNSGEKLTYKILKQ
ncbi:T9SS type A sorting domain-containing protein [Chryseobacterium arthrosphaerae]|nr:T9SS type A sorting domain-containing protein [Chryseobacterium arthrosphaerae]